LLSTPIGAQAMTGVAQKPSDPNPTCQQQAQMAYLTFDRSQFYIKPLCAN